MAENDTFGWASADAQALVTPSYEYYRKNRWIMDFAGLPAALNSQSEGQVLRLNCKTAQRPKLSFEETEVHRINGSIFLAGKPKFESLQVVFYDNLRGQGYSASDIVERWRELIYQPNQGDAFGAASNYKGFGYLHMLAPVQLDPTADAGTPNADPISAGGSIEQTWLYQGLFPQNIDYSDVDYSSSEVQEVTVTFRYDRAYRIAAGSIGSVG